MKTIVVIPTYNERENISKLIPAIFLSVPKDLEILIVDDNSPDHTANIVTDWQKIYPQKIHLIKREKKSGLGSAYITGFHRAKELGGNFVMEMDADFSHDPKDLPKLIAACVNGADLAIGSRKIPNGQIVGWNWYRKIMSNEAMAVARWLLNLKTKDVTAGFRCYRQATLDQINLEKISSNGYAFQEEMLYKIEKRGFTIKEIPVIFIDRKIGQSKLSIKDIFEFFIKIIRLKFNKI